MSPAEEHTALNASSQEELTGCFMHQRRRGFTICWLIHDFESVHCGRVRLHPSVCIVLIRTNPLLVDQER